MTSIKLLTLYIGLLIADVAAATLLIVFGQYTLTIVAIAVFAATIYQLYSIYLDSIRKVSFMFNAIDCDDYAFKFTENISSPNSLMLNSSLNRIKEIMTNAKLRAMEREKYYELIMNSVKTGIVTVNERGNVYQVNEEIMRMLGLKVFTHLKQLRSIDANLCEALTNLKPGERTQIVFRTERGDVSIAASASSFTYDGKKLKIIAVNDINNELDEKQIESWIKLTRVLTHEIMNSLAPITSLSDTLIDINPDKTGEVAQGLETISTTGKSLIAFVSSYRKFTRLQAPVRTPFSLATTLERLTALICKDIPVEINVSPNDILLYADEDMVVQVIVNLLKNAVQAATEDVTPRIVISAQIADNESITVAISNTGHAIPSEMMDDIFMPFFTTKPNGSGIGLSLAKQIMRLHEGSIKLTSNVDGCVTFSLVFP